MKFIFISLFIITSSCINNSTRDKKDVAFEKSDSSKSKDSSILKITDEKQIETTDSSSSIEINTDASSISLIPAEINLKKGLSFSLQIPLGYKIAVAAEGLRRLRFLSKSRGGKLFATDMFDKSDNHKGSVVIFSDWDDVNKKYNRTDTFLSGLHNPNQVAFYGGYIYVAETGRLTRYKYDENKTTPSSEAEVLATFPDYGLSYKYGGWHLTRSLSFHNNKLYVSVGSSCNACVEKEEVRASVLEMNPDGTDSKIFARGLRNSVGIKWIGNQLWATGMGRDLIGPDKPEDLFLEVKRNGYYGWPFYFQYQGKIYADEQFKDSVRASYVVKPPVAMCGFKAHSAPLGFDHFTNFSDKQLNNSFLVALHGSTTVSRQRGNAVVKDIGTNKYIDVVSGFLQGKTEKERFGRPCDVMMNDDHSFFITDDHNGVLYYLYK